MRSTRTLLQGDCLSEMKKLADESIDCIICDLPYGSTSMSWDSIRHILKLLRIGLRIYLRIP